MTQISFVASSARDTTAIGSNPARLLNLYHEPVETGGRTANILRPAYGMGEFAQLDGVFVRDLIEYDGFLYAILPGGFYRVRSDGAVLLGTTALGETATLSRNLNAVTACIGGAYYVWDTAGVSLSSPSGGAVTDVAWVEYLAGRTIRGEVGTGKFDWSDIADPSTFDGLNVATAEAREDETIRGIVAGNLLYLMGRKTTEIWQASGLGGANAFQPLGVVVDRGLKSFGLVCIADGAVFAIGDDDIAYIIAGNNAAPVSSPAVISAVRDGQPESCMFWEERGHKFCAITFFDRPTWVYDLSTRVWWERCEGPERQPWRGRVAAKLGDWIVGGADGGLYTLTPIATDAGAVLYREATSYALDREGWFTIAELEFKTSAGFESGEIAVEIGDGVTFRRPRIVPLPAVGKYDGKTKIRRLGRHKLAVARISMTGPALSIFADCNVVVA